jgi:hypothetical protein
MDPFIVGESKGYTTNDQLSLARQNIGSETRFSLL